MGETTDSEASADPVDPGIERSRRIVAVDCFERFCGAFRQQHPGANILLDWGHLNEATRARWTEAVAPLADELRLLRETHADANERRVNALASRDRMREKLQAVLGVTGEFERCIAELIAVQELPPPLIDALSNLRKALGIPG